MLYPDITWDTVKNINEIRGEFNWHQLSNSRIIPDYFTFKFDQDSDLDSLLDIYGSTGILDADYFIISQQLKELLIEYKISEHAFFECIAKVDQDFYNYYIFQFLSRSFVDCLNFNKSVFTEWGFRDKKIRHLNEYQIKDYDHYLNLWDEIEKKDKDLYPGPKKMVFKKGPELLDFLMIPVKGVIVSKTLMNKILSADILGIEFEEIADIEFYLE